MKIVCESCGAKYSIADEKVAGKVFKIRCKKCSAVIVVKGDTPDGDESTRVYDYGGEAIWHVVVAGEQQGPFAPRQIGELLADGKIDWSRGVVDSTSVRAMHGGKKRARAPWTAGRAAPSTT